MPMTDEEFERYKKRRYWANPVTNYDRARMAFESNRTAAWQAKIRNQIEEDRKKRYVRWGLGIL